MMARSASLGTREFITDEWKKTGSVAQLCTGHCAARAAPTRERSAVVRARHRATTIASSSVMDHVGVDEFKRAAPWDVIAF